MHPYWITIDSHLGVGGTARSEAEALQLFALAFPSREVVRIEIIKDMNDLDQNHVVPNLGGANWLQRTSGFPWAMSTLQTEIMCSLNRHVTNTLASTI